VRGGLLAIAVLAAEPAAAQIVSEAPQAASITIYRAGPAPEDGGRDMGPGEGLAQITETRTIEVPAGRGRVSFRGVADTIVPQTVAIEGLPGAVLERNQDYDLLSPGALVKASLGETVRLVRTNRATGKVTDQPAVIRSAADGVVLQTAEGLEALSCSGAPERLVFDKAPEGLADKPTLSVLTDTPKAGRYTVRLSYLATGFTWRADYVAHVRPDGRTLDLIGWLTLTNRTAANFGQAPTEVVAGELSRSDDTRPTIATPAPLILSCWPRALAPPPAPPPPPAMAYAAPMMAARADIQEIMVTAQKRAQQSDLGDYKLYTLPEPTTVAARQTKQVLFLDETAIRFERIYAYRLYAGAGKVSEEDIPDAADIVLRLQNTREAGLGKPLPSGVFAVMEADAAGRPILAGEHRAERDTPVGLPLELTIGRAMDVTVSPRVVSNAEEKDGGRYEVAVEFENRKPAPVVVQYRHAPYGLDFRVEKESERHGTKAGDVMWTLRLAAGEHRVLRYTVSYKDG